MTKIIGSNSGYGLIIALVLLFSSCKKSGETVPEPTIIINIQSPVEGMVLAQGDTLYLNATISSPVEIHGYEWKIKDKANGTDLKWVTEHAHGKNFTISGEYVNQVSAKTEAELEIVVEVNHEGEEARKTVSVTLDN
jgi:hypothetical protein